MTKVIWLAWFTELDHLSAGENWVCVKTDFVWNDCRSFDFIETNAASLGFNLMQELNFDQTEFDKTILMLMKTPEEIPFQEPYIIAYMLYTLFDEEFSVDQSTIKNIIRKINLTKFDALLLKFIWTLLERNWYNNESIEIFLYYFQAYLLDIWVMKSFWSAVCKSGYPLWNIILPKEIGEDWEYVLEELSFLNALATYQLYYEEWLLQWDNYWNSYMIYELLGDYFYTISTNDKKEKKDNYELAEKYYQKFIALWWNEWYFKLGKLYLKQKNFDKAETYLQQWFVNGTLECSLYLAYLYQNQWKYDRVNYWLDVANNNMVPGAKDFTLRFQRQNYANLNDKAKAELSEALWERIDNWTYKFSYRDSWFWWPYVDMYEQWQEDDNITDVLNWLSVLYRVYNHPDYSYDYFDQLKILLSLFRDSWENNETFLWDSDYQEIVDFLMNVFEVFESHKSLQSDQSNELLMSFNELLNEISLDGNYNNEQVKLISNAFDLFFMLESRIVLDYFEKWKLKDPNILWLIGECFIMIWNESLAKHFFGKYEEITGEKVRDYSIHRLNSNFVKPDFSKEIPEDIIEHHALSYAQEVLSTDYIWEDSQSRLLKSFETKEFDFKSPRDLIYSLAYFYHKKDLNSLILVIDEVTQSKFFDKLDYINKLFVASILVELENYWKAYYILWTLINSKYKNNYVYYLFCECIEHIYYRLDLVSDKKLRAKQQSEILDSLTVIKDLSERMLKLDSNNEKYLFYRILWTYYRLKDDMEKAIDMYLEWSKLGDTYCIYMMWMIYAWEEIYDLAIDVLHDWYKSKNSIKCLEWMIWIFSLLKDIENLEECYIDAYINWIDSLLQKAVDFYRSLDDSQFTEKRRLTAKKIYERYTNQSYFRFNQLDSRFYPELVKEYEQAKKFGQFYKQISLLRVLSVDYLNPIYQWLYWELLYNMFIEASRQSWFSKGKEIAIRNFVENILWINDEEILSLSISELFVYVLKIETKLFYDLLDSWKCTVKVMHYFSNIARLTEEHDNANDIHRNMFDALDKLWQIKIDKWVKPITVTNFPVTKQ